MATRRSNPNSPARGKYDPKKDNPRSPARKKYDPSTNKSSPKRRHGNY